MKKVNRYFHEISYYFIYGSIWLTFLKKRLIIIKIEHNFLFLLLHHINPPHIISTFFLHLFMLEVNWFLVIDLRLTKICILTLVAVEINLTPSLVFRLCFKSLNSKYLIKDRSWFVYWWTWSYWLKENSHIYRRKFNNALLSFDETKF